MPRRIPAAARDVAEKYTALYTTDDACRDALENLATVCAAAIARVNAAQAARAAALAALGSPRQKEPPRPVLPPGAVEIGRVVAEEHSPVPARGPYRVQVKAAGRWRDVRAFRRRQEALAFARGLAGDAAAAVRVWTDQPLRRKDRPA